MKGGLPTIKQVTRLINTIIDKRTGRTFRKIRRFPFIIFERKRFLTVRMDIINRCNLRCKMCYFALEDIRNAPLSRMSPHLFQKIANDVFPQTQHLIFSAGAEPLMSQHFPEMLTIAQHYHLPYISFFTNGMLLDKTLARQIIISGINEIHFSVDGATKATYESIRVGARFEELVANIQTLHDMKIQCNSLIPKISFQIVLMHSNIDELPASVSLAQQLHVENINASLLVPYKGLNLQDEVLCKDSEEVKQALLTAKTTAHQNNIHFGVPPGMMNDESPQKFPTKSCCQSPWTEILVNPDGSVYPCCFWYEETSMGNFIEQTFQDIWEGEAYTHLRTEILSGNLRSTCAHCPVYGKEQSHKQQETQIEFDIVRGV